MFRATQFALFVALLFAMSAAAQATAIPLVGKPGTTLLADGFEGVSPGSAPVAVTGTWGIATSAGGGGTVLVRDQTYSSFAAYEGSQYVEFSGNSAGMDGFYASLRGTFGAGSDLGDTLTEQVAFRVVSGGGFFLSFERGGESFPNQTNVIAGLFIVGPSGYPYGTLSPNHVYAIHSEWGDYIDTGAEADSTRWNTLSVTHTNGQTGPTSWSFSLNGEPTVPFNGVTAIGDKTWQRTGFTAVQEYNPRIYLDAVPEPGTIVLLGTGLLGLLAYAWRRRRA